MHWGSFEALSQMAASLCRAASLIVGRVLQGLSCSYTVAPVHPSLQPLACVTGQQCSAQSSCVIQAGWAGQAAHPQSSILVGADAILPGGPSTSMH